jgi:hypothetical protein
VAEQGVHCQVLGVAVVAVEVAETVGCLLTACLRVVVLGWVALWGPAEGQRQNVGQTRGYPNPLGARQGYHTHLVQLGPGYVLLVVGKDGVCPALQHCLGSPEQGVSYRQLRGRKEGAHHHPFPYPCTHYWAPQRGCRQTVLQGTYVFARWVVKTYTNCEEDFPETPPPPPPGASGRRPGGGPCGGPGALLSLRGSWAVWLGPSCGAVMAGSATLQSVKERTVKVRK